jgi:hypothetical protein
MSSFEALQKIPEWHDVTSDLFTQEILPSYRPAVLKKAFFDWQIVQAGCRSPNDLFNHLLRFDKGHKVTAFASPPASQGHFFYGDNICSFNFQKISIAFKDCLARILAYQGEQFPPAIYMGSTPADNCLPGLMRDNPCPLVDEGVGPRLWMGNESIVQPHFDISDNIAVVVAGRRRFTLFPPDQIDNLYVGPIDVTPAGQPMSMVSLLNPDLTRYPRYKDALATAMVAELEPGDAIFIPSLWWHGVHALDKFNLLVNYWWNHFSVGPEDPYSSLIHGILTISSLPEKQRMAWKSFFDHYVFQVDRHPLDHLPLEARGVLSEMTPELYQIIRGYMISKMAK